MEHHRKGQPEANRKNDTLGYKSVEMAQPTISTEAWMPPPITFSHQPTIQTMTDLLAIPDSQLGTRQEMFARVTEMGNREATKLAQTVQRKQQTMPAPTKPSLPDLTIMRAEDIIPSETDTILDTTLAAPVAPPPVDNALQRQQATAIEEVALDEAVGDDSPLSERDGLSPDANTAPIEPVQRQAQTDPAQGDPATLSEAASEPPDGEQDSSLPDFATMFATPEVAAPAGNEDNTPLDMSGSPPAETEEETPPPPERDTPPIPDIGQPTSQLNGITPPPIKIPEQSVVPTDWADKLAQIETMRQESRQRAERATAENPATILGELGMSLADSLSDTPSLDNESSVQTSIQRLAVDTQGTAINIPKIDTQAAKNKITTAIQKAKEAFKSDDFNATGQTVADFKAQAETLKDQLNTRYATELGNLTSASELGLPEILVRDAADTINPAQSAIRAAEYLAKSDAEKLALQGQFWKDAKNKVPSGTQAGGRLKEKLQAKLAPGGDIENKILQGPIKEAGTLVGQLIKPYVTMSVDIANEATFEFTKYLKQAYNPGLLQSWTDPDYPDRQAAHITPIASDIGLSYAEAFDQMEYQIKEQMLGFTGLKQSTDGVKTSEIAPDVEGGDQTVHQGKQTAFGSIYDNIAKMTNGYIKLLEDNSATIPTTPLDNWYLDIFDTYCRTIIALDNTRQQGLAYLNLVVGKNADGSDNPDTELTTFTPTEAEFDEMLDEFEEALHLSYDAAGDDGEAAMASAVRWQTSMLGDPLPEPQRAETQAQVDKIASDTTQVLNNEATEVSRKILGMPKELASQVNDPTYATNMLQDHYEGFTISMTYDVTQFNDLSNKMKADASKYADKIGGNMDAAFEPIEKAFDESLAAALETAGDNICNTMAKHVTDVAPHQLMKVATGTLHTVRKEADSVPTYLQKGLAMFVKIVIGIILGAIATAITLATAGSAGALVAALVGGALGAIFGAGGDALGQFLSNVIMEEEDLSKGVGMAALTGAIGGLITGAVGGGIAKILGNSSTARTALQMIASESIDTAANTGATALESIITTAIDNNGVIDWEQVGLSALIGGATGLGLKALTRGPATLYKFVRGKPSPYKSVKTTKDFMNEFSWEGSGGKRNWKDFGAKFKEELYKRSNPLFPGTHKSKAELDMKFKDFDVDNNPYDKAAVAARLGLGINELNEETFKKAFKKLDKEGKKELFKLLPADVQRKFERERKLYMLATFSMDNKWFDQFAVKQAVEHGQGKESVYAPLRSYQLPQVEIEDVPMPEGEEAEGAPSDKLPQFVGNTAFEFEGGRRKRLSQAEVDQLGQAQLRQLSKEGKIIRARENRQDVYYWGASLTVKNLHQNVALLRRHQLTLQAYMRGEVDEDDLPKPPDDATHFQNMFNQTRTRSVEERLRTTWEDLEHEEPRPPNIYLGFITLPGVNMISQELPQLYIKWRDRLIQRAAEERASAAREIMALLHIVESYGPGNEEEAQRAERDELAKKIRSDKPHDWEEVINTINSRIDGLTHIQQD